LRLLSESTGSLLDDEDLVNTLQQSKITSEEVTQQLVVAEETEKKIDHARQGYRSAAVRYVNIYVYLYMHIYMYMYTYVYIYTYIYIYRSSLAYFVLDDMSRVDPMYQFSLDAYVDLFNMSIDNSRLNSNIASEMPVSKRCDDINTFHTLAVYRYTCRGLFESHKLLFSLQLCIKILETQGVINQEEFNFFSLGAGMLSINIISIRFLYIT
jgi:dynein heavy chain